jgi:hypothetical protein
LALIAQLSPAGKASYLSIIIISSLLRLLSQPTVKAFAEHEAPPAKNNNRQVRPVQQSIGKSARKTHLDKMLGRQKPWKEFATTHPLFTPVSMLFFEDSRSSLAAFRRQ